jgi:aspartyl-tRNA synthetase
VLKLQRKYSSELSVSDDGMDVTVAGWVHAVRPLKDIAFLVVRDRDGTTQVTIIKNEAPELFEKATQIPRESVVLVRGKVKANKQSKKGFEVIPSDIQVLSAAKTPLPLGVADKVGADLDTRLDNRFLDVRKPEITAIFRIRHLIFQGIRDYLDDNGFVEVSTPKIVAAGAEGGATLFPVQYFDKKTYLAQSPQLYKQMLMGSGLDRVYEIAPAFRAELSDTVRHTAEFISYDAEISFIDSQEDVLRFLEESVVAGLRNALEKGKEQLDILKVEIRLPKTPVPRLKYTEALEILKKHGRELKFGDDIDTECEKLLGTVMEKKGETLYFITDYPATIKPFYVMVDGEISHSFDLDFRGQEIASGGQREHRHEYLVKRMQEMNLDPASFGHYLKTFEYGMPPHGGWGLGMDRLVQKVLNLSNIRETILFPRDRARVIP